MTASSSMTKRSGSPCGCGGSGKPKSSSCGCGGSCGGTCAVCQSDNYMRPRFFAGQLLTEDDLQQLNEYVVAKNRLHNRHLFGAGVVCGLEVSCYPCGGGKVIVNPGYALDCCGNDIVLACPQELDINQMVRDLQRKMHGGFDCGDPCKNAQQMPQPQQPQSPAAGSPPRIAVEEGDQTTETDPSPAKRHDKYCLYVNYCEQASDPVSPYVTDEPCGLQSCETTRVREGFRFELRCPDRPEPSLDICERLQECLGDDVALTKARNDSNFLGEYARKIAVAQFAIKKSPSVAAYDPEEFLTKLTGDIKSLQDSLNGFSATNPADAQKILDASIVLASDVARHRSQPVATQQSVDLLPLDAISKNIDNALNLLKAVQPKLLDRSKDNLPEPFDTQLAKDAAASLFDLVPHLSIEPTVPVKTIPEQPGGVANVLGPHTVNIGGQLTPTPVAPLTLRLLVEEVVFASRIYTSAGTSLEAMRAVLISRLEQESMKTHCGLLDIVVTAPKPRPSYNSELGFSDVDTLQRSASILTTSLGRLIQTCFCNALNPPCPACDDPGVLLACITLEDCKVKDICNLDRQFVLSPVAVRYWVPEISRIGNALEQLCCPDLCADQDSTGNVRHIEPRNVRVNPDLVYQTLVTRLLFLGCEKDGVSRLAGVGRVISPGFVQSVSGRSTVDFFREDASGTLHSAAAVAATTAENARTVTEVNARLEKARIDQERLRADFSRLAERFTRLEKKTKNLD